MNTPTLTPLDHAIAAALGERDSGIARIAAACGTSKQFVHKMRRHWRETGAPPKALREYAAVIEQACDGAVRAEALYPGVEWLRDASGAVVGYTVTVSGLPAGVAGDGQGAAHAA